MRFLLLVVLPSLIVLPLHLSRITARLANTPTLPASQLTPIALFFLVTLVVYTALRLLNYRGHLALPSLTLTLCGIGLALQARIGNLQTLDLSAPSQFALPIGLTLMLATYWAGRYGRLRFLERIWPFFLALAILIISFVLIAGRQYRGATFLPGNINPVEIVKPLLVLAFAAILTGHKKRLMQGFLGIPLPRLNSLLTLGLLWAPPMILLVLQGDMGMFALLNATLLVMLYGVTKRPAYLLGGFTAVFFLARLLIPLSARGRARLEAWLDPFTAATGGGWQPLQALVALYSGGFLGTGIGAGSPNVVPIIESDFAYIIIGEELGLVGCILVAALYASLVLAGLQTAERASNTFRGSVATGLSACLGLQILLNIGGVVKAIPLTGIPLPFISHGGSSLITTFLMVGLLLAIHDETPPSPIAPTSPVPPSKSTPRKNSASRKSQSHPKTKAKTNRTARTPRTPRAPRRRSVNGGA